MKQKTYYISTRNGNDSNTGTSPQSPFFSLQRLSQESIGPGTGIYLERGSQFEKDFLHLKEVAGNQEAPIRIESYGDTALPNPCIHAKGMGVWYQDYGKPLDNPLHRYQGDVSSAVLLYDCSFIEMEGIEITNTPETLEVAYNHLDMMNRTGVAVVAQNRGTLSHIHLKGLFVHHVMGNVYDKHMNNGGIYFTALQPLDESKTGIARYHNIRIEDCVVEQVNRWGIAVAYTTYWDRFAKPEISDADIRTYGATDVIIRRNFVRDVGGDAITPMYCDQPLIERNVSIRAAKQINKTDYCATEFGRVAAGVWPWKCKNALFQYNDVSYTYSFDGENQDGQAFDADWADGTIYQYNYSHNNEGGCFMVCGEEAVNTVFRYNISQNDSRAILMPASSPLAFVSNNTFYIKQDVPFIATNSDGIGAMVVKNNLICYYGSGERIENWYCDVIQYSNNLIWGYTNIPENGENTVQKDPMLKSPGSGGEDSENGLTIATLDGYQLTEGSPAIGAGVCMTDNQEKDFFGNTATNPPSIGVHQPKFNQKF